MTKTWSIQEFKANVSEAVRNVNAQEEPQVITRHGKPVAALVPMSFLKGATDQKREMSAWEALRGNFDFSDMPENDDWLERDRSPVDWRHPFEDEE